MESKWYYSHILPNTKTHIVDIQENPFTEALLDDIESHPCIAAASRDIDDVVERWYALAANRFLPDDFDPFEDNDQ